MNLVGLALIAFIVWVFWLVTAKGCTRRRPEPATRQLVLVEGG